MRALLFAALFAACGAPPEPAEAPRPLSESTVEPPPEPVREETEPAPEPVTTCGADADCHFDDPCVPTRCEGGPAPDPIACAESGPIPGRCICIAERCTLRREEAAAIEGACTPSGEQACGFSAADGTCRPGHADERPRIGPAGSGFPICECVQGARCSVTWQAPVPCRTGRDCWWGHGDRGQLVPVAPPRPRRRFVPCRDGEREPECVDGFCGVGDDPLLGLYGC